MKKSLLFILVTLFMVSCSEQDTVVSVHPRNRVSSSYVFQIPNVYDWIGSEHNVLVDEFFHEMSHSEENILQFSPTEISNQMYSFGFHKLENDYEISIEQSDDTLAFTPYLEQACLQLDSIVMNAASPLDVCRAYDIVRDTTRVSGDNDYYPIIKIGLFSVAASSAMYWANPSNEWSQVLPVYPQSPVANHGLDWRSAALADGRGFVKGACYSMLGGLKGMFIGGVGVAAYESVVYIHNRCMIDSYINVDVTYDALYDSNSYWYQRLFDLYAIDPSNELFSNVTYNKEDPNQAGKFSWVH